jgi:hypothetical protein
LRTPGFEPRGLAPVWHDLAGDHRPATSRVLNAAVLIEHQHAVAGGCGAQHLSRS